MDAMCELRTEIARLTNENARLKAQLAPVANHYVDGGHLVYPKAQRQWVGLTRMELIKLGLFPFGMSYRLYEAVEAKLKEKNT